MAQTIASGELLHKELTADVIAAALAVHNALGCGLLEKVYENALVWELTLRKHKVIAQQGFRVTYRDKEVGLCYADVAVDGKVVVEVKAVDELADANRAQLLNYLRISRMRVGLLMNFARPRLRYKRFVV